MLSRYLRTREKDGIVAVFHELHPDPVYCPLEQWNKVAEGAKQESQKLISALKERGLIVETAEDDQREFERVEAELERKLNQPTILYLMTARGCNFGCKYCPVPEVAKRYGEIMLSTQDALAGIDLWEQHLKDVYNPALEYFVIFYGGEPLLNKEAIIVSLNYLKKKRKQGRLPTKLNTMIATNGALVDEGIIALCKKHKVIVAVGLDGPEAQNDTLRVTINGEGTQKSVVAVIRLLVRNGIRTVVSVSITPFNIDQIPQYAGYFKELGVEKFGFNFLKGRLLVNLVGQEKLEAYYRAATKGIIGNARHQGKLDFEYQMEKKRLAFESGNFYPVDCTCYGNQLVIQPDGQISNCPFYQARLGHVASVDKGFRIWRTTIVKEWRKRLPLYHSNEAKAFSGGGCAWSSSEIKGDPMAADDSSQIFSEEILNEYIWARYTQLQSQKA